MITDLEEETLDLDWFSVDVDGEIAHFASGGRGFLPPSVKASRENLNRLIAYFRSILAVNGDAIESPNFSSHKQFQSEAQKSMYLADYSQMGAKGLYSFDYVVVSKRPSGYFVVARPSHPLNVEILPHNIQEIIKKTCFFGAFSRLNMVEENEFGSRGHPT